MPHITRNSSQSPAWRPPGALRPTGENLWGWNSAPSNFTWPQGNCISLHNTYSVDLRWVNMCAYRL